MANIVMEITTKQVVSCPYLFCTFQMHLFTQKISLTFEVSNTQVYDRNATEIKLLHPNIPQPDTDGCWCINT